MTSLLDLLTPLAEVDDEVYACRASIRRHERAIAKAQAESEAADKVVSALQGQVKDHASRAAKAESEIAALERRIETAKANAHAAPESAQRRIDQATAAIDEQMDVALEALDAREEAATALQEALDVQRDATDRANQTVAENQHQIDQHNLRIAELRNQRSHLVKALDIEDQRTYRGLMTKRPKAIYTERAGACPVCQRKVASQQAVMLTRQQAIRCQGCGVWLRPTPKKQTPHSEE